MGPKPMRPIDYSVLVEEMLVLVQEIKKDDFEKRTAQNKHSGLSIRVT